MTTLESPIDNAEFGRRKHRILKWLCPILLMVQAAMNIATVVGQSTVAHGVSALMAVIFLVFVISFFWFRNGRNAMKISITDDTITVPFGTGTRSIQVADIDPTKSTHKHGIVKLVKKSTPFNDPIEIILEAIIDPATWSRILAAIDQGMTG